MTTRREFLRLSASGIALCSTGFVSPGGAEPAAKTVHILTGFAAGLPDAVARIVADQMKGYAPAIVVETRPGATGRIAVEAVKTADPDGSVVLCAPLGFLTLFPHTHKTLKYEARDFIPVSTVASFPALLTVGPKVPGEARTLADFVAWCRANPKLATYGTPGVGSTLHLIGAMLGRGAEFEYLHIPYQGRAAIEDVAKGEIASAIMPLGTSLGLVQSGHIRALATTGPRRSRFLPDVPTMVEAGYPTLEDVTWYGFFLPAKTPVGIVEKFNSAIQTALSSDEVRTGLTKMGLDLDPIALDAFDRLIASESDRWKAAVQASGFAPAD
jgi:tripartite-type tricarboxylate transporter receptor subunit TctC